MANGIGTIRDRCSVSRLTGVKRSLTYVHSVGECIAQLATNPPEGPVTVVSNSQIIDLAKKWREANPGPTGAA
jgi:hypothetical protein